MIDVQTKDGRQPLYQVQFISCLLSQERPNLKGLRDAAALLHAPLLLVYTQLDSHDEGYNSAAIAPSATGRSSACSPSLAIRSGITAYARVCSSIRKADSSWRPAWERASEKKTCWPAQWISRPTAPATRLAAKPSKSSRRTSVRRCWNSPRPAASGRHPHKNIKTAPDRDIRFADIQ